MKYRADYNRGVCYIEYFELSSYIFEINNNLNQTHLYDVIFAVQDKQIYAMEHNR